MGSVFFFAQFTGYLQKAYPAIFRKDKNSIRSDRLSRIGWYLSQKSIAKQQVFNQPGKTPMQSVFDTCVYDVFEFMNAEAVESQENRKHSEAMRKRKNK